MPKTSAKAALVAELDATTSRIARQSYQKEPPSWDDLEMGLRRAAAMEADVRWILAKTQWCHRSAVLTGVAAFVAETIVALATTASTHELYAALCSSLLDQLTRPCFESSTELARACKWRKVPRYMDMQCTTRWKALSPALTKLVVATPDRFAACLRATDLQPLFNAHAQCAVVVMNGFCQVYHGLLANASCPSMLYVLVRAILSINWTSTKEAPYRDDLLCRLFRFLQELPFKAAPQSLFAGLQEAIVESLATPHEGVVLLTKLTSLLSEDLMLRILGDCYDLTMATASLQPEAGNPYLRFLMGFCAHTTLVPTPTIVALLGNLFSPDSACATHKRLAAAYYIALHRKLDLRREVELQRLLLDAGDVHQEIPDELTSAFFITCFHRSQRDIDLWLAQHEIGGGDSAPWASMIPFATLQLHPRAIQTAQLANEIPCVLAGPAFEAEVAYSREKRRRTARASVEDCLDPDVLLHIFGFLSPKRIARLSLVSRAFHHASSDPNLWRRLYQDPTSFVSPVLCLHDVSYVHDYKALFAARYRHERSYKRQLRYQHPEKKKDLQCCNVCDCLTMTTTGVRALAHAKDHQKKPIVWRPCPTCGEQFPSKNKLLLHKRALHGKTQPPNQS
ncbi:hypothetical protein SDRG_05392 [Saprolegnia diclina VS20]|uniref:C2H2-type domain-containing protein n=1 Tax=Saprolegnia diclina (strain VS20) TaxID=1156394 RepID=T0QQY7_SAPDV|nr:hypothetical protein SDRG_05392 [Saprolegnia diclina VS20]EQC37166.1 hypothetical protein SDRG_05392 [Saprolegnia diclina VS20]|eukprot:XP_008609328.1 hypothetical protein SDRG_05392 [Saprolegnia diclina VS20]